jgi:Fe-S-cluster containining protein
MEGRYCSKTAEASACGARYARGVLEDCVRCGACCFSESDRHARVTGDDYERLGDAAAELVVFIGNQAFMRIERTGPAGRCAALVVDASSGTFLCSVYDRRPQVCRDLERGSPACEGERFAKGDRPKRTLAVLARP